MLKRRHSTVLLIALALGVPSEAQSQTEHTCRLDPAAQAELVGWVTRAATAQPSDSAWVAQRLFLLIPATTSDSILAITDAQICQDAGNAVSQVRGNSPPGGRSVLVVKVAGVYVVTDPGEQVGEWTIGFVFDHEFNRLSGFMH